jgi:Flp pilus assembly pilin Flp
MVNQSTAGRRKSRLRPPDRSERGTSLTEYALVVALIAVVAVAGVVLIGHSVSSLFVHEANCINMPVTATPSATSAC